MSLRTALSIVQEYRKGIGLAAPTALAASIDTDEMRLLEILNQVLEYLRDNGPWRGHIRTYDFNTSSSDTTYSLPGDYWEPVPLTHYNENTQFPMYGPLSDREFAQYQERGLATPYEFVWRVAGFDSSVSASVEGRLFEIFPAPSGTIPLTFEYVSGNLYLPAAWFASQDSDMHERLAADTDYCAFDSQLVKLGIDWKYREATSSNVALIERAKKSFDEAIKASRYRLQGARTGSFGPKKRRWHPVPEGNWSFS